MPSHLVHSKSKKKVKVTQEARKNKALKVLKHKEQFHALENVFLSSLENLFALP